MSLFLMRHENSQISPSVGQVQRPRLLAFRPRSSQQVGRDLQELEVRVETAERQRQPAGIIDVHDDQRSVLVSRHFRPASDLPTHGVGGGVHHGADTMLIASMTQSGPDVGRRIATGDGARSETTLLRLGLAQAIEPEGTPVLSIEVVGQQVPAAAHRNQPQRFGAAHPAVLPDRSAGEYTNVSSVVSRQASATVVSVSASIGGA